MVERMRGAGKDLELHGHALGGILPGLIDARARVRLVVGATQDEKQRNIGVVVEVPLMFLIAGPALLVAPRIDADNGSETLPAEMLCPKASARLAQPGHGAIR